MTTRTILSVALWCGLAVACSRGKAPTYPLASGPSAPAAQGSVEVKAEGNGNTRVAIDVRHLAPPASVSARATTYVAWIVPRGVPGAATPSAISPDTVGGARPINVGAINVNSELRGSLETTTPFQQFDVIITPEPSAVAMRPSNDPVLTARVQEL